MGGIESGADALAFIATGATAIAVGTANFRDPLAGLRVREQLAAELELRGHTSVEAARGRFALDAAVPGAVEPAA
jgi:dihydroorotate dehydrogenase (NAD+) catalytic subunit